MTDIQTKIANMYAKNGAPSCLPEDYQKEIAAKKEAANPYLWYITEAAKHMLRALESGKKPEGTVNIRDWKHSADYEVSLFNQALKTFNNNSAKAQGYGLYAEIETTFTPIGGLDKYAMKLYLGPPVN